MIYTTTYFSKIFKRIPSCPYFLKQKDQAPYYLHHLFQWLNTSHDIQQPAFQKFFKRTPFTLFSPKCKGRCSHHLFHQGRGTCLKVQNEKHEKIVQIHKLSVPLLNARWMLRLSLEQWEQAIVGPTVYNTDFRSTFLLSLWCIVKSLQKKLFFFYWYLFICLKRLSDIYYYNCYIKLFDTLWRFFCGSE